MIESINKPTAIHYKTLLNYVFQDLCLDRVRNKLIASIEKDKILNEYLCGSIKIISKDIFFAKVSKLMEKYIWEIYPDMYLVSNHEIIEKVEGIISWFSIVLYAYLKDIEAIQIGSYRVSVISENNDTEIYSFENADLSFVINYFHDGLAYNDAIDICGSMYSYIIHDDFLCKFKKGLKSTFTSLGLAVLKFDSPLSIYPYKIKIQMQGKNN